MQSHANSLHSFNKYVFRHILHVLAAVLVLFQAYQVYYLVTASDLNMKLQMSYGMITREIKQGKLGHAPLGA